MVMMQSYFITDKLLNWMRATMLKKTILAISVILLVSGCVKSAINSGNVAEIEKRVHHVGYFNMTIVVPDNWAIQSQAAQKDITKLGEKIIAGKDEAMKRIIEQSEKNRINLFAFFKYEIGSPVSFNPNIAAIAEKVSQYPGIKRGSDYLYHVRAGLTASPLHYDFPSDIQTRLISNVAFDILPAKVTHGKAVVSQEYYAAKIDDYVLTMVLTYSTEDELSELLEIVDSATFSPEEKLGTEDDKITARQTVLEQS